MSFLYPSFLWALGALSIPVIIHLFNFRKTTRIYFSNNRFLKQVKEATTAKRRIKHYLILASRLLFIFFLVLTFAQPIIPAKEQLGNNRNIILYLDNSQSMSAQLPDKTKGLEAAVDFVNTIATSFPPDTRYKLITNDFAPFSNSYKTKPEILELLTQIRLSPVSRTMQEIIDRIHQDGRSRDQEIFWISDFQKSTMGTTLPVLDSSINWHLVPIEYASQSNIFVDSVYLDNPFAAGGEKNVLRVKVRNDGAADVDQLNLKLAINNIQAAATTINVPRNGINETTFDLATTLKGMNEARITFNDLPVSFDNEFYLTLNFTEKIRVVEIKRANTPTPIEKVFGNALVFDYKGSPISNFNYDHLNQADLVVVNGLNTIDPSLGIALREYLSDFGTVLIIPGNQPDVPTLRSLMQLPLLNVVDSGDQLELDRPDFSNPFFENVFEEKSVSMAMPKAKRILDWGNDRDAILRFKNDMPFLSVFEQQGKLYAIASPLEDTFTDFYNNALFVPVMYRIAASGKKSDNKLYYTLRENFINLRVDSLQDDQQVKFVGSEDEVIPGQRQLGQRILIDLPKFTISEGFYKVVSGGDTINRVAFNLDKAESLMDQYSSNEISTALGRGDNISIFEASSTGAFSNEIKERYLGTPLWKYALLSGLFFLLVEILLIRFLK